MKKRSYIILVIVLPLLGGVLWCSLAPKAFRANVQLAKFYASQDNDGEKYWILRSTLIDETSCTDEEFLAIQEADRTRKFGKRFCSSLIGGHIVARSYPYRFINGDGDPHRLVDEIVLLQKTLNGKYKIVYFTTRHII